MFERRVMVADGAMGTMLLRKGPFVNRCLDELNRSLPALVRDVHQDYLRAGAEILRTNTFGANRQRLERFGFGDKVWHINQAGARIAREAARDNAFVAGCVGPLGVHLEPLGPISAAEARALFRQQIEALVEAGVDLLMLETFCDLDELREAIAAAAEVAGTEMIVCAEVSVQGADSIDGIRLGDGSSLEDFTRALDESPAAVIGVNCSSGPASVLRALEEMAAITRKPLSASPSAGVGHVVPPAYFGRYVHRFVRCGARLIGGCCGTEPEHIQAVRFELRDFTPPEYPALPEPAQPAGKPSRLEPVGWASKSKLAARLASGQFVGLVEAGMFRGPDTSREVAFARQLKSAGIDAVVVPASTGVGAKNACAVSHVIQQQAGIETVLQIAAGASVRQIESDLMGVHALGIRNVLLPGTAAIHIANNLNRGLDLGGHPLGSQTSLLVGTCCDSGDEIEAAARAGAEFVITHPVFDADLMEELMKRFEGSKLAVIAAIRPLTSFREAEYLMNEKQVAIPTAVMARLGAAESSEAARAEGVAIARETVARLRGIVAGVQLVSSSGTQDLALDIAAMIGE
jgi:homocysteine S-methyltransferase